MDKLSAFVIEDDINLALAFAEAITSANFSVEVIYDGATAKERLSTTSPDLVILDLHIPHISGMELLKFIKSDPKFTNTRVIVASADALTSEEVSGSADLVLLKPVGFRQLKDLALRLLPGRTE